RGHSRPGSGRPNRRTDAESAVAATRGRRRRFGASSFVGGGRDVGGDVFFFTPGRSATGEAMISFVIPAYNGEQFLGRTLTALTAAARGLGQPFEVVVVDDASTDRTGAVAREHGARVVPVAHRQIAATRNAGARAAAGEMLVFIDADTVVTQRAVAK